MESLEFSLVRWVAGQAMEAEQLIASRVIGISISKPEVDPSKDLQWEDEQGSPAKVARTTGHGFESGSASPFHSG